MRSLSTLILCSLLLGAATLPTAAMAEQPLAYQETRQLGIAKKDVARWEYNLKNEDPAGLTDPAVVAKYEGWVEEAREHVAWFPSKKHPDVVAFAASVATFEANVAATFAATGGAQSAADLKLLETVDKDLNQLAFTVEKTDPVDFAKPDKVTYVDDLTLQIHYAFMTFENADHPSVAERKATFEEVKAATEAKRSSRKEATAGLGGEPAEVAQQLVDKWYAIPFPLHPEASVKEIDAWTEAVAERVNTRESDIKLVADLRAAGVDEKTGQRLDSLKNGLQYQFKTSLDETIEKSFRKMDWVTNSAMEARALFIEEEPSAGGGKWFMDPGRYRQRIGFIESTITIMPALVRMDAALNRTDVPDRADQLAKAKEALEIFARKQKEALDGVRMPAHNGDDAALAVAKKVLAHEVARGAAAQPARIVVMSKENDRKTTWERDRNKIIQADWSWTDIFAMTAEPQEDGTYRLYYYRIRKWNQGYLVDTNEWKRSERFDSGQILEENIHK